MNIRKITDYNIQSIDTSDIATTRLDNIRTLYLKYKENKEVISSYQVVDKLNIDEKEYLAVLYDTHNFTEAIRERDKIYEIKGFHNTVKYEETFIENLEK